MKTGRAFCVWLALFSIVFALAPPLRAQDTATGQSKLVGRVFADDGKTPIQGAIVGKAIYEGAFTIQEAITVFEHNK